MKKTRTTGWFSFWEASPVLFLSVSLLITALFELKLGLRIPLEHHTKDLEVHKFILHFFTHKDRLHFGSNILGTSYGILIFLLGLSRHERRGRTISYFVGLIAFCIAFSYSAAFVFENPNGIQGFSGIVFYTVGFASIAHAPLLLTGAVRCERLVNLKRRLPTTPVVTAIAIGVLVVASGGVENTFLNPKNSMGSIAHSMGLLTGIAAALSWLAYGNRLNSVSGQRSANGTREN